MMTLNKASESKALSTYGVEQTTWVNVRAALKEFGAEETRVTSNHKSVVMTLPGGTQVHTGKPAGAAKVSDTIVKTGIRGALASVRGAGIHPMLFLAVLDNKGCSWYKKPTEIGQLQRFLREEKPDLTSVHRWKATMREFRDWIVREDKKRHEKPVHGGAADERKAVKQRDRATITTGQVVDMAGLEGAARDRAIMRISTETRRTFAPLFKQLKVSKDFIRIPKGKIKKNLFTEAGALSVAEWLVEKYGPEPAPQPEAVVREEQVPAPQPEAAGKTLLKSMLESGPPQTKHEFLSPAQALLYLCERFDVEPAWNGYTLAHEVIILRLANAMQDKKIRLEDYQ